MSEAKNPPIPVPRKSKQNKSISTTDSPPPLRTDDNTLSDELTHDPVLEFPADQLELFNTDAFAESEKPKSTLVSDLVPVYVSQENATENVADDYEKPTQVASNDDSTENTEGSQIYEEFSPGAPWQQELVAWLMAREFGNSMPLGTRPLPQSTESSSPPEPSSLSFMPSNLAQRASLVLSRLSSVSPSTRLLVDIGQSYVEPSSAHSSLRKKKSNATVVPLTAMNDLDRDFLSLFGVNGNQKDRSLSESTLTNNSSASDLVLAPEVVSEKHEMAAGIPIDENDHICEEFPVVSLRKGQAVRISVDRQDGSLCWVSGNSEKGYRSVNGTCDMHSNHHIHRRILAYDLLRVNVDVKSRHVVHLATVPGNQYAKDSPFSYACGSIQSAVALVTCIAKTVDAYSLNILSSINLTSCGGVLCLGKILYRQQTLQPWTQSFAIITESRHFVVIRPKVDQAVSANLNKAFVDHSIDLRYIRELRQESVGEADGSRLLYMRFGTSTASSLYVRPVCACSSNVNCVCSAAGCDPCATQFNTWQSILENLTHEVSATSRVLSEQRMSESDLPAIVDRILSHLTLSCLTTEGLHRQAGRVRVANDLLAAFKRDPWSVRFESSLKDGDAISAHDIVSTLKKFFQSLDRPLLLTGVDDESERCLATSWIGAHYSRSGVEARLEEYRKAFSLLHPVARRTLQAMLLHLRTVAALEAQNRMNFLALAASWGPTLMCSQSTGSEANELGRRNSENATSTLRLADVLPHGKSVVAGAIGVVIDLLSEMDSICPIDAMSESVRRDAHVQDIAVRLHLQPQQHKQAGEITLQVEVALSSVYKSKSSASSPGGPSSLNARRRSSHAVHVAPRLTAADLIKQLCVIDEGIATCSNDLSVWEYLAGGELRRPLHPSTRLLDVCCSWASLEPEALRNDCKLVIEAAPMETEENSLYEFSDHHVESESIISLKTSIPCSFGGLWTAETFVESSVKLKHWLYISDSEVVVKSMKAAPTALIGAAVPHDDRQSKVVRSGSSLSSQPTAGVRSGGAFRSFFSALSHINPHRIASNGRVKFSVNLVDIGAVYAAHRNAAVAGSGTAGVVIACRSKATSSDDQLPKYNFYAVHVLNEPVRDRLLSYFFFSLLSPESCSSDGTPCKKK